MFEVLRLSSQSRSYQLRCTYEDSYQLVLNAAVAWLIGLLLISVILYFSNGGSDFTLTDVMGFGVMTIVASGVLMLLVYLPSLYWLRRRQNELLRRSEFVMLTGVICNFPIFYCLLSYRQENVCVRSAGLHADVFDDRSKLRFWIYLCSDEGRVIHRLRGLHRLRA